MKPLPLPSFSIRFLPTTSTSYLQPPPTATPIRCCFCSKSTLPTSTTHHTFPLSWRWLSRLISFYLLSLNLVAAAPSAYPASSKCYPCEDIDVYYSPLTTHLRGEALKKKLNAIVASHHSLSYPEVWDALKVLDAADIDHPEASSSIVEIYSLRVVSKRLSRKPQGWNREHLWPRSYGLMTGPSLTDLHNIRPSDVNVNSSRGNKYYGECMISSNKCLRPANKEAALDTETDKQRWAPPARVRGDIARALMYMAVAYGFQQPGGSPGLRLSDTPNVGRLGYCVHSAAMLRLLIKVS
ncbi:hypothetical protein PIB30_008180 [Stylosanthes scabra]|uniref:Uncharacterized protein n=1 Tax=Stylosanthes scabra TaxID=79078 RepID=A0ABU6Z5G3_9FABA|nr:hypothetical protein [Stylosanthes scabra]